MRTLLKVCRTRNMKLAPSKFQLGRNVIYGGSVLKASAHRGGASLDVCISTTQDKLYVFLDIQTTTYRWTCRPINQMDTWSHAVISLPKEAMHKFC